MNSRILLSVHRGQQYGEDVLSILSEILNKCTTEGDAPVAALALEGLYALCEAEVGTHTVGPK